MENSDQFLENMSLKAFAVVIAATVTEAYWQTTLWQAEVIQIQLYRAMSVYPERFS